MNGQPVVLSPTDDCLLLVNAPPLPQHPTSSSKTTANTGPLTADYKPCYDAFATLYFDMAGCYLECLWEKKIHLMLRLMHHHTTIYVRENKP